MVREGVRAPGVIRTFSLRAESRASAHVGLSSRRQSSCVSVHEPSFYVFVHGFYSVLFIQEVWFVCLRSLHFVKTHTAQADSWLGMEPDRGSLIITQQLIQATQFIIVNYRRGGFVRENVGGGAATRPRLRGEKEHPGSVDFP